MKRKTIILVGVISFMSASTLVSSCKKDEAKIDSISSGVNPNCGASNISSAGSIESHNFGQNCLTCHSSSGNGDGCFTLAGSVSNSSLLTPLNSGTVKLYSQPNGLGSLIATVQIDANGNFNTTQSLNLVGNFPVITGSNGVAHSMGSALNSGACNSCHGVSTTKLWAN